MRRSPNLRRSAIAFAGLLALAAAPGCESLGITSSSTTLTTPTTTTRNEIPKKPGGVHPPLRVSQFVFYSDVPLNPSDAVFRELEELPEQVQRELRLPAGPALVQVYLFEDQAKYEAYMGHHFPTLEARRAYFISPRPGTSDDLQVYTWFGEHLRIDLRHELTHGLLHGVLKEVPLWLDEGLAGFFEQPPATDGVNSDHLEQVRKGPFQPDLARLEKIGKVKSMQKPEYREAWAWVHFMLRGEPKAKEVLLDYLQQLRTKPDPGSILPRLRQAVPDPHQALGEYLAKVEVPTPTARGRIASGR